MFSCETAKDVAFKYSSERHAFSGARLERRVQSLWRTRPSVSLVSLHVFVYFPHYWS
jgi:hypothetical protein